MTCGGNAVSVVDSENSPAVVRFAFHLAKQTVCSHLHIAAYAPAHIHMVTGSAGRVKVSDRRREGIGAKHPDCIGGIPAVTGEVYGADHIVDIALISVSGDRVSVVATVQQVAVDTHKAVRGIVGEEYLIAFDIDTVGHFPTQVNAAVNVRGGLEVGRSYGGLEVGNTQQAWQCVAHVAGSINGCNCHHTCRDVCHFNARQGVLRRNILV